MFANKKTKVNKTPVQTSTPILQYTTFCPYPFPFYNYNSSPKFLTHYLYQSLTSNHGNSQTSIPKIQKFLEDLDEEFGVEKFTCYVENFIDESIDVLDILELKENDFDKLGITNIGIKTKIIRKAKQYSK